MKQRVLHRLGEAVADRSRLLGELIAVIAARIIVVLFGSVKEGDDLPVSLVGQFGDLVNGNSLRFKFRPLTVLFPLAVGDLHNQPLTSQRHRDINDIEQLASGRPCGRVWLSFVAQCLGQTGEVLFPIFRGGFL